MVKCEPFRRSDSNGVEGVKLDGLQNHLDFVICFALLDFLSLTMTVWQSNLKDDSSNDPTRAFNQILKITVSFNFVIVFFYFYRFS